MNTLSRRSVLTGTTAALLLPWQRALAVVGDLSNDGVVNISDAVLYLKQVVGVSPLTSEAILDQTGNLDIADAVKLLRQSVGLDAKANGTTLNILTNQVNPTVLLHAEFIQAQTASVEALLQTLRRFVDYTAHGSGGSRFLDRLSITLGGQTTIIGADGTQYWRFLKNGKLVLGGQASIASSTIALGDTLVLQTWD